MCFRPLSPRSDSWEDFHFRILDPSHLCTSSIISSNKNKVDQSSESISNICRFLRCVVFTFREEFIFLGDLLHRIFIFHFEVYIDFGFPPRLEIRKFKIFTVDSKFWISDDNLESALHILFHFLDWSILFLIQDLRF